MLYMVAVIAAVSALLGAAIGGAASYLGVRAQSQAETTRENEVFVRDERKTFYSEVIDLQRQLQDYERAIIAALSATPDNPVTSARLETASSGYDSAVDALIDLERRAPLVSSRETIQVLSASARERQEARAWLSTVRILLGRGDDIVGQQDSPGAGGLLVSKLIGTSHNDDRFIELARADLGFPPLG